MTKTHNNSLAMAMHMCMCMCCGGTWVKLKSELESSTS